MCHCRSEGPAPGCGFRADLTAAGQPAAGAGDPPDPVAEAEAAWGGRYQLLCLSQLGLPSHTVGLGEVYCKVVSKVLATLCIKCSTIFLANEKMH